jgi:hypothetical protein
MLLEFVFKFVGSSTTKTGAGSPLVVTGLINGLNYSMSVYATNSVGGKPSLSSSKLSLSFDTEF